MSVTRRWLLESQSTSCLPGRSIRPEATSASASAILDSRKLIHDPFPLSFKPISLILDRRNLPSSLCCPNHLLFFKSSHGRSSECRIASICGSLLLPKVRFLLEELALHPCNVIHQLRFLGPHCLSIGHKLLQLSLLCLTKHPQFLPILALNCPSYLFLFD